MVTNVIAFELIFSGKVLFQKSSLSIRVKCCDINQKFMKWTFFFIKNFVNKTYKQVKRGNLMKSDIFTCWAAVFSKYMCVSHLGIVYYVLYQNHSGCIEKFITFLWLILTDRITIQVISVIFNWKLFHFRVSFEVKVLHSFNR